MTTLLLTGANGIVGCELARTLARQPDPPSLKLLIRGEPDLVDTKARWLREWIGPSSAEIEVLRGELTAPDLGLDAATADRLQAELTGILHAGACTPFGQTRAQGAAGNVEATRSTLRFAGSCRRLDRFGFVSTAWVAGSRVGPIAEDDLDPDGGFCNEYERSKAEAEREVRLAGLPAAIYRLSIVVGRRTDGRISRMSGVYPVWRILHQGLMSMIPGDPEQTVDLIPSDFAAEAIAHLFGPGFVPGVTRHVCAGPERSFTLGELLPAVADCVDRFEPGWKARGYPEPAAVDSDTFASFADTVELIAHVKLRATVRQMRLFTEQLRYPKVFSTAGFERDLAGSGIWLDHAREWLPMLIAEGVRSGWRAPGWEAADGR